MKATFTFVDGLNDFLPRYRKNTSFDLEFEGHQSLKHLIESMGVPHTEFGQVLVDGKVVDSSSRLRGGEMVTVYPAEYLLGDEPCFILDNHLGQLATYLRMLGFDSLYQNDFEDEELTQIASAASAASTPSIASQEVRTLLTRDRRLLMRKAITRGYCLHHTDPRLQAVEVLRRFNLFSQIKPFQRCLRCNSPLQVVDKQEIIDRLEPLTKKYYQEFHWCPSCNQIYWKGSHFEHMQQMIIEMSAKN